MPGFVKCRCPQCGHIRGEAQDGSSVRLQCRQCRIYFFGIVSGGKFISAGSSHDDRRVESAPPPSYKG